MIAAHQPISEPPCFYQIGFFEALWQAKNGEMSTNRTSVFRSFAKI
jgi:hypothetical protein